jgi:SAM-dependent methyltransferase
MALAQPHVALFWSLRSTGVVGAGKSRSVLEFGEQNWYGDVEPAELGRLLDELERDEIDLKGPGCAELRGRLNELLAGPRGDEWSFDLAKLFYRMVFGEHAYRAVDLHGTAVAEAHDLNLPLPFSEQFDVVTNLGTAEHVFNQYQVFKSAHDKTKPGGIMIHALPNQGCYDHGFYNYHPTFVFDLSQANGYRIVTLLYTDGTRSPIALTPIPDRAAYVSLALEKKLSNYSGLLAVLRRPLDDVPFAVPRQGYYDNQLPPELAAAWSRLPR